MDLRARTPARRLGEAITTLVFALALALPMGGRFLDEGAATSTLAEQRSPAPLPEAPTSPRGLLRIPREFDAWLNDGFGFRRFLIRGHNAAKLFLFRTTPTEQLLLGDDLWLYTTGNLALEAYRGAFRLNEAELELWRRTLEDRRDWLAARGIQYVFLVAPDKADVYPEQLPSSIVRAETTTLDQLIAHMRARSDFRVLEIRAPLLAAKADDREHDFLYYPQGTHWSDRGAYVGYVEILRALRDLLPRWADDFEPWPRGDFERVVKAGVGDGWEDRLHLADVMRQRNVRLIPRRERRAREVGAERGLDGKLYEIPGSELPRGLMLHDSFGALLREPLAEHFSYFHTANSLDLETELVLDTKPDVVIQVLAERRLAAYRPLGSSLTQGEDLRARFEAAEVVCIELDQAHELETLEPWRKARVTPARGPEDPTTVRTIGGGQGFLIPPVELPAGHVPLVRIDIESAKETSLTILYQTTGRRDYVSSRAVSAELLAGRNVVYLEVPAPDLSGSMLVLPGTERGRFELRAVEVRAVK